MSINGVGAYGAADPGQLLARMLSRLDSTNSTQSTTSASSTSSTANTGSSSAATESAASTALTGTGQSALSDQIMALLVQLQQQSPSDGAPAGTAQTPNAGNPVQNLFSAMDGDGDGTVSQKEMETYIAGKGGTQAQADALFSALNQNGGSQNASAGISEQQLGADVSQTQHAHHHHHHHGSGAESSPDSNSGSDIASQIFGAVDTNQDGKISSDELATAFNTSNTTSGASTSASTGSTDSSTLFSQVDSNGDGSVSSDEIGSFLSSLAKQTQSDFNTLGMFGQLAAQSYEASAGLLNKTGSGQSSYA
jgi:Ca2+-binding EF-hand superfamily protein